VGDDDRIKVYGAAWCGDCRRAERFLTDQRVPYEYHDIEHEPELIDIVRDRNAGKNIIPTIVFPDGSHLSEPTNEELAAKLGLGRQLDEGIHPGG
jgi:glutaredoxin